MKILPKYNKKTIRTTIMNKKSHFIHKLSLTLHLIFVAYISDAIKYHRVIMISVKQQ